MAENEGFHGTFLETAHPLKFADTVEKATGIKPAKCQKKLKI
jgi:threonine synthase